MRDNPHDFHLDHQELTFEFMKSLLGRNGSLDLNHEDMKPFRDPMTEEITRGAVNRLAVLEAMRLATAFQETYDKLKDEPDIFKRGVLKP